MKCCTISRKTAHRCYSWKTDFFRSKMITQSEWENNQIHDGTIRFDHLVEPMFAHVLIISSLVWSFFHSSKLTSFRYAITILRQYYRAHEETHIVVNKLELCATHTNKTMLCFDWFSGTPAYFVVSLCLDCSVFPFYISCAFLFHQKFS